MDERTHTDDWLAALFGEETEEPPSPERTTKPITRMEFFLRLINERRQSNGP